MAIIKLATPVTPNDLILKTNEIIDAIPDSIGATVSKNNSSAVTIPTSTYTPITSVTLEAGVWLLIGTCHFSTNASGVRRLNLSSTPANASWKVSYPASDAQLKYQVMNVVAPTEQTDYYLNAWQNSGASLSCSQGQGAIEAVRII